LKSKEVRKKQDSYEILGTMYNWKGDDYIVIIAATDVFGFNKQKNLQIILISVFIISLIIVYFAVVYLLRGQLIL